MLIGLFFAYCLLHLIIQINRVLCQKVEELEDKDTIIAVIHEAAKFLPLEQLALSPQCGFSSTEEGNSVSYDAQWRKLQFVNEIVAEV